MTARGTMETVMAATRGGAFDYVAKPFELGQMLETVKRAEASVRRQPGATTRTRRSKTCPNREMIGSSPSMVEIYKIVSRVAPTDATVLIEGETGTGKELIARMIHRNSKRADQPFAPGRLRLHRARAARKRTVRRHARRLHRRRSRPHGRVRGRQPRHGLPGRDRRHRAQLPVEAAAFPAGARDPPAGRAARQAGGCARDRRHQPRPPEDGGGRQVPRGPLVPPQRRAHHGAAVARAPRRRGPAGPPFPENVQRALRPERPAHRIRAEAPWRNTPGPATCASCST